MYAHDTIVTFIAVSSIIVFSVHGVGRKKAPTSLSDQVWTA